MLAQEETAGFFCLPGSETDHTTSITRTLLLPEACFCRISSKTLVAYEMPLPPATSTTPE